MMFMTFTDGERRERLNERGHPDDRSGYLRTNLARRHCEDFTSRLPRKWYSYRAMEARLSTAH